VLCGGVAALVADSFTRPAPVAAPHALVALAAAALVLDCVDGWLARYALVAAGWWLAWLRVPAPPRYWRKVVAAYVGIALLVAASGALPTATTYAVLVAAGLLLAESFGWDVVWLWRRRVNRTDDPAVLPVRTSERTT
jgi:hypothetical protein